MWLSEALAQTAPAKGVSKWKSRASPWRSSAPGALRAASRSMSPERSRPETANPRASIGAIIRPLPQHRSSTRAPAGRRSSRRRSRNPILRAL